MIVANHEAGCVAAAHAVDPLRTPRAARCRVFIKDIVLIPSVRALGAPHDDTGAVTLVGNGIVCNHPVGRAREFRTCVFSGGICRAGGPVLLNPVTQIVIDHVVRDRNGTAVHIDTVLKVAAWGGLESAIVIDDIAINENPGSATCEDTLIHVVMYPVPPKRGIMSVVHLDAVPAVPDFEPLDPDPSHRKPIAALVLDQNHKSIGV